MMPNKSGDPRPGDDRARRRRATAWAALAIVLSLVGIGIYAWLVLGDMEMSLAGYIALASGVIATVALGIGLMALLFYSHRYGYDEQIGRARQIDDTRK